MPSETLGVAIIALASCLRSVFAISLQTGEHAKWAMDLSSFRAAVAVRPTPPDGYTPIPALDSMKSLQMQGAKEQGDLCWVLYSTLIQGPRGPMLQEPMYIQGAHEQAIKAMRSYPNHITVQNNCGNFLSQLVQNNWVLAHAIANAGALDVMIKTGLKLTDDGVAGRMQGYIATFLDFDHKNRRSAVQLGLLDNVYSANSKSPTADSAYNMYCLWSTVCREPDIAENMVGAFGELERAAQLARVFRSARNALRGEILEVHNVCFVRPDNATRVQRSWDAGMVPEIVSAIRDELSGEFGELDILGPSRLLSNAMEMLRTFAGMGETYRQTLRKSGAVEQVQAVVNRYRSEGAVLRVVDTLMHHPDLRIEGQKTLDAMGHGA